MKPAQKTLAAFPEYLVVHSAVQKAQLELQRIGERKMEIQTALMGMKAPPHESEWDQFKESGLSAASASTNEIDLREEFKHLDQRERFVTKALEIGLAELGKIGEKYSREICEEVRPQFVAQIRRLLECIKAICEINLALEKMRDELVANGVRTGSLPYALFDIGLWNDPFGGKVVGYQRFIAESYPELADAAGQEINSAQRV
jgi:hypothetical protein